MTELQPGPITFFTTDHRDCDEIWSTVEAAAESGDLAAAKVAWQKFDHAMRRHFAMEEEVLFPAFEAATGMQGGPTQVMREEHVQMRGVLDQMAQQATSDDYDAVVDLGDTLLMIIQQHNVKEEGILYPMVQQALGDQWPELVKRLETYT